MIAYFVVIGHALVYLLVLIGKFFSYNLLTSFFVTNIYSLS